MENQLKIYQEEKPWGNFRQFTHDTPSTVKIITINSGEEISLQSHTSRAEFWRVISGDGVFEVDGKNYPVMVGTEHYVPVGVKHRIKAGTGGVAVLEISLGKFDEGDIIRYEDKYGRV